MKRPFHTIGKTVVATTIGMSVLLSPVSLSWKTYAAQLENKTEMQAKKADDTKKQSGKQEVNLRILGTTDIHTNLYNYDYYKDAVSLEFGLAKTATLIKQLHL